MKPTCPRPVNRLRALTLALLFTNTSGLTRPGTECDGISSVFEVQPGGLQHALNMVCPGDTVKLGSGEYEESVMTTIAGTIIKRITIEGPQDAIIKGDSDEGHVFDVQHSYYTLDGFTIDGEIKKKKKYMDKLLYIQTNREEAKEATLIEYGGQKFYSSINGVVVKHMTIRNGGGECVRLRYFVTFTHIHDNHIHDCGIDDYVLNPGEGKNGEAVYIGTAVSQWGEGDKDPKSPKGGGEDSCRFNTVSHNDLNPEGNECVDIKEGSSENIIQNNKCWGQYDDDSAGLDSRGDSNIFRYNEITATEGSGIRMGGHKVNGQQFGVNNMVYGNTMSENEHSGIKIMVWPQSYICGNSIDTEASGGKLTSGDKAKELDTHPGVSCPQFPEVHYHLPIIDDGDIGTPQCQLVKAENTRTPGAHLVIDGDSSTRWKVWGKARKLNLTLGAPNTRVNALKIKFHKSKQRRYLFDMVVLDSDQNVVAKKLGIWSSGNSNGFERFGLDSTVTGAFIVLTARGNRGNNQGPGSEVTSKGTVIKEIQLMC